MSVTPKPKRKNDEPPRFPAWVVVVVAIGLVIVAFLLFRPAAQNTLAPTDATSENFEITATYLIQQATDMAQATTDPLLLTATALIEQATAGVLGTQQTSDLDPIVMTASAIVEMATAQSLGTQQPNATTSSSDLDPFVLTATAIVQQATDMASTPAP